MSAEALEPLARCCESHPDWQTLSTHLVKEFRQLDSANVVRELARAKRAAEGFSMPADDEREIAELMTRQQLLMLCGQVPDVARLDPERHLRAQPAT